MPARKRYSGLIMGELLAGMLHVLELSIFYRNITFIHDPQYLFRTKKASTNEGVEYTSNFGVGEFHSTTSLEVASI